MNHSEVKTHLADYLEGDIDLGARALVDAHLDDCADCAQEVAEMQQTIGLLRMLPEPEQPSMVAANVMRRVRAGETEPGFFERIGRVLGGIFEPTFVLPASAVAAAAFVVVVVQDPGGLSGLLSNSLGQESGQGGGSGTLSMEQAANPMPSTAAMPLSLSPSLTPSLTPRSMASNGGGLSPTGRPNGGATRAQLSAPRSFGAPAAQDFLAASGASTTPRVYSDVGISSGLRNARAEVRTPTGVPTGARTGATRTETRVRTRIQVDRDGRPIATLVERSQGGGARGLAPNSLFPVRGNGLAGGALPVAGPVTGLRAPNSLRAPNPLMAPHSLTAPNPLMAPHSLMAPSALKAQGLVPSSRGTGAAAASDSSSGGEDVRDLWLARGLEDPVGFANFIAERNLAEQELWVSRLSERASERGMLADLLTALRASGDDTAAWVADDFAAGRER